MAKWLTQPWLDEVRKLAQDQPARPGVSARVQVVVTGGPDGETASSWVVEEGMLADARLGRLDEPDVTFTAGHDVAVSIQKGELDPSAAFMQGNVKVAGDMSKVMALLPVTSTVEYRRLVDDLATHTEF
jgi:putative sterol carrier protein